jgi:hypothetical protein
MSTSADSEPDAVEDAEVVDEAVDAIEVACLVFLQGTGEAEETSLR